MEASPQEITALAEQLTHLARGIESCPDPASKKLQVSEIVLQAKKIIWQAQDPFEAMMDHIGHSYAIASALALSELGVFEAIPLGSSMHVRDVAIKCETDEALIIRLMRMMTSVNIFTETGLNEWSHNRLSVLMSSHLGMSGKDFFEVTMDEFLPSMHGFNRYLKIYGKQDVHTYTEAPYSWASGMLGKDLWGVLGSEPARIDRFMRGLSHFAALHPVVAIYPFETELQAGNSADRTLAVDIGGGRGLAMLELRKGCPSLQGSLVLQDRPQILDAITAQDSPGVIKMPHDFFTEQPVKNAQFYYIRRVMHDWQDEDAARILKAIVPAMGPDSRVLISDMALPEPVTIRDSHAIWLDLMMLTIGGKERTVTDWHRLADLAGLRCVKVWQEAEKFGPLCVVEYVLPDAEIESQPMPITQFAVDGAKALDNEASPPQTDHSDDVTVSTPEQTDWEERTVVGDREQSVEPSQG